MRRRAHEALVVVFDLVRAELGGVLKVTHRFRFQVPRAVAHFCECVSVLQVRAYTFSRVIIMVAVDQYYFLHMLKEYTVTNSLLDFVHVHVQNSHIHVLVQVSY